MLQFDKKGHLTPGGVILSDLTEFESVFVSNIQSERRKTIFQNYLTYSNRMKIICQQPILQWINGSFCTQKPEPGDIDVVSFIPYQLIEQNENVFKQFSYPYSENEYGVDAYLVKIYPETNRYHPRYIGDRLYWKNKFNKTKVNRVGKQFAKGFLEIIY